MHKTKIHIDRLQIRLKGGSANSARRLADGLGNEILNRVSGEAGSRVGARRIETLETPKISNSSGASAADLQKQIARQVADLVGDRKK